MRSELERRLAAQLAVTQALAVSATVDEATQRTLAAIGTHLGWTVGTFWLRDALRDVLYPAQAWGTEYAPNFASVTRDATLACGVGLPGRAWDMRTTAWEPDVQEAPNFPRAAAAARDGLHAGLAIPVEAAGEFLGVIELFTSEPASLPDSARHTLEAIGSQIGQFIAQRRAVASEHAAQRLSAAMVAVAIDCIITIDAESRILEFNPAAERTFGRRRQDVLGKPMIDLIIPPELRAAHRHGMARYLATGEAHVLGQRIEVHGMRASGEIFPVELTILRVDDADPPIFTAYLRERTEQKRLESAQSLLLGASEILSASLDYEETLRNLSAVVVPAFADWYAVDMVDPSGAIRRLEVSHRDPDKISIARDLAERFPDDPEQLQGVHAVIRTGESQLIADISDDMIAAGARTDEHLVLLQQLGLRSAIIVALHADHRIAGAITLVTAESQRCYDERDVVIAEDLARRAGQAIEKALLFAEVSGAREQLEQQATELESQAAELEQTAAELQLTVEELRTTNDALRAEKAEAETARRQADEANAAKSDFLASMSHELRTPLNAIMGYAQLLELGVHGALADQQREDLKRIDRSAHHLLGLITDILNFAKAEAGQLTYQFATLEIGRVLQRVEELIAPQAAAKRLTCECVNSCSTARVCADEEKLVQVFVNLVSNAVRYTPSGGRILIECRADDTHVFTDVSDTGVGIPPDKLEAIFEPFVQVDSGYAGERQGTGLGLSISRELTRAMHGDLTVRSTVGSGSVFTVALPREP